MTKKEINMRKKLNRQMNPLLASTKRPRVWVSMQTNFSKAYKSHMK